MEGADSCFHLKFGHLSTSLRQYPLLAIETTWLRCQFSEEEDPFNEEKSVVGAFSEYYIKYYCTPRESCSSSFHPHAGAGPIHGAGWGPIIGTCDAAAWQRDGVTVTRYLISLDPGDPPAAGPSTEQHRLHFLSNNIPTLLSFYYYEHLRKIHSAPNKTLC